MFVLRRKTVGCLVVGVMIIAPLVWAQEAEQPTHTGDPAAGTRSG